MYIFVIINNCTMAIQLKDGFRGSRMIVLPASVVREMKSGEFTSLLYVTDIGYYPHAQYHYRHRPHGTQEYILIYCTDGKGWIWCDGIKHTMRAGLFFIIPAGHAHTYAADEFDPWSIYWIHFAGTMSPCFGDGYDHVCEINVAEDSRISSRLALFEELYRSLETGYSNAQLNYSSAALTHLLGTFKYIDAFRSTGAMDETGHDIIDRCRHYILENIERKITLNDICSYLGHSSSYCTSLFNKFTGMSPGQYLQNLRIQTAAHLMEVTNMQVNQVCHKVGIEDPYYFSRLFTKIMGVSPRNYKQGILAR